jgi:outer membrane protein assembly factor BamB
MRCIRYLPLVCLMLVVIAAHSLSAQRPTTGEWTQWRGGNRDGVTPFAVPSRWPAALTRQWEIAVGAGHSSPVVAGGLVVLHAREGDREMTRALDLASGAEQWRNEYAAPYTMNQAARGHGPGPKSTPVVSNGRVVTFGISGILSAHDLATGKLLWRTDAPPAPPEFGTAMSPVIDGGLVIAHIGGEKGGALTAFDLASGAVTWRWAGDGPGYASPVVAVIAGERQVVTQTERHVVGVGAADGQLLWQIPFTTPYAQNSVTPIVAGDLVVYSGLEQGTAAVRVVRKGAAWATEPVWQNDQVGMYMSSPVVSGSTLYGLSHRSRGQLFALDLDSGKTLWTTPGREAENASIVLAGETLLVSTTNAELIVARASRARFEEVKRYTIAESAVWAHPAFAGNLILIKDVDKLICWRV